MNYLYRESIIYWHWLLPVIFQDLFPKAYQTIVQPFERSTLCEEESERIEFLMVMNKNSKGKSLLRVYDLQSMMVKTFHLGAVRATGVDYYLQSVVRRLSVRKVT